jgi:D-galactarolactone isomerase
VTESEGGMAVPFSAGHMPPDMAIPNGACDCHMHLFDGRYPFAPEATLVHETASAEDYLLLRQRLGLSRCVLVQPSSYGLDHTVLLAGLKRLGSSARGIAVITPELDGQLLHQLNDHGVIGARFNLVQQGATHETMLEQVAERIGGLGWHLQLHLPSPDLLRLAERIGSLNVPVVLDHFARVATEPSLSNEVTNTVLSLMETDRVWVKLSGAYIASSTRAGYADLDGFVSQILARHPERVVWGSDWPHVTETHKPDDAKLMMLLDRWAPDPQVLKTILIDNPKRLYGF